MPMMFADPTYDTAFKRLFGDKGHPDLTKSFLNAVLDRKNGYLIDKIIFTNTEKTPRFQQEKKTYIDIQCTDQAGNEFIIEIQIDLRRDEMQSAKEDFFKKRAQYYVAHEISRQLNKKGFYANLTPVIFIGVLDFNAFDSDEKNPAAITHHLIINQATQKQDLNLMEFHFVELPKFTKTETELTTEIDRWLYFFKKASELEQIPKACAQSSQVFEAFQIMERATWDKKDWLIYEEERKLQLYFDTQDYAARLRIEESKQEGERKKAKDVALKLLKKQKSLEEIAELTDLSIEEIKVLQKKM